jgi:hypothetical protein
MAAVQMFCLKLTPIYRNPTLRIEIIFSSRAIYYHRHGCCSPIYRSHTLRIEIIFSSRAIYYPAVQMFCQKLTPIYRNHTLRIEITFSSRALYYHRHGCCSPIYQSHTLRIEITFSSEQFIIIDMAAVQMFCLKLTPIYRNHTLRIEIIFSSRAIYYHRHGCCSNVLPKTHTLRIEITPYVSKSHFLPAYDNAIIYGENVTIYGNVTLHGKCDDVWKCDDL